MRRTCSFPVVLLHWKLTPAQRKGRSQEDSKGRTRAPWVVVSSQEGTGRAQVRGPQADRAAHSTQSSPAPPQTPLHTSATRRLYLKPASLDAGLGQLQGKTSSVTHQTPLTPLTGPPTLDTLASVVLPHLKLGWRVPNTPPRSPPFLKLQISQGRTASATPRGTYAPGSPP